MKTIPPKVIGVDLGGTKVSAGVVFNGQVEKNIVKLLPKNTSSDNIELVTNFIIDAVSEIFSDDISGIGIGVPSVLERKTGIIYGVQNLPCWKEKDIPLKEIFEKKFKIPVYIDNDANCFALGEKLYGKGRPYSNFIGMTIGTGLGGGIIYNNKLLPTRHCGSGEFGEMYYLDGRLEDYCSSLFFIKKYGIEAKELAIQANKGDEKSFKAFDEFGYHLARAIKMIMFALDPDAFIIGGSITKSKTFFEKSMINELHNFSYSRFLKDLKIEFTDVTQFSPILGAAAICLDNEKREALII